MKDANLSEGHLLSDKVDVYLNGLRATMLDGIGRHVNSTYVVTIDNSGGLHRKVQVLEKLA
jgi:RNase adaptor protein for sRNA GlmZ degradation